MPKTPDVLDECISVNCRKCDRYLATIMPKAEALCNYCLEEKGRAVWTRAVAPKSETKNAQRLRAKRQLK